MRRKTDYVPRKTRRDQSFGDYIHGTREYDMLKRMEHNFRVGLEHAHSWGNGVSQSGMEGCRMVQSCGLKQDRHGFNRQNCSVSMYTAAAAEAPREGQLTGQVSLCTILARISQTAQPACAQLLSCKT